MVLKYRSNLNCPSKSECCENERNRVYHRIGNEVNVRDVYACIHILIRVISIEYIQGDRLNVRTLVLKILHFTTKQTLDNLSSPIISRAKPAGDFRINVHVYLTG